jgi:predicted DNA-binding transcriptional regulator AlpA
MMEKKKLEAMFNDILTELRLLRDDQRASRNELHALRTDVEQRLLTRPAPPPRADDLVPVEYLAQRTGLSRRTILAGKANSKTLLTLRVEKHPSRWRRSDVDTWVRELVMKKEEQAKRNFRLLKPRRKSRKKPS